MKAVSTYSAIGLIDLIRDIPDKEHGAQFLQHKSIWHNPKLCVRGYIIPVFLHKKEGIRKNAVKRKPHWTPSYVNLCGSNETGKRIYLSKFYILHFLVIYWEEFGQMRDGGDT